MAHLKQHDAVPLCLEEVMLIVLLPELKIVESVVDFQLSAVKIYHKILNTLLWITDQQLGHRRCMCSAKSCRSNTLDIT